MPIRDVKLDNDGNRVMSATGQDYAAADGIQAIEQGIACAVKLYRGEYWLDQSKGVDWVGKILIRNPQPLVVKGEIGAAIAGVPDVSSVVNTGYAVDTPTRAGTVTYSVASTQGPVSGTVTQ